MGAPSSSQLSVRVADEVWIATALLHREHPERKDFTITEIVDRARREQITQELRPGVQVHASQHCVANRPPNPGRYRMLIATGRATRRLFRPGDPYDPKREGAKTTPSPEEIPSRYHELLDWYQAEYVRGTDETPGRDPLLALRGLGRELWQNEDADEYVRRLREGWE
ncbi:MAG TPA: hypothetical protein VLK65_03600 [Vicinamibacteria bacterium]|nr:hypothetical protein [Vicinamibacteria bacterium]